MYLKRLGLSASIIILLGTFLNEDLVKADDHHKKYYKQYEEDHHKKMYEDDDDDYYDEEDDYYYYESQFNNALTNVTTNTWNVWTRTTNVQKGELPFQDTRLVQLKKQNGDSIELYIMPVDGELFVPAKKVAQLLDAEVTLYKISEILEVNLNEINLIFRAGTNVVYSNGLKTPLPSVAFYLNDDVYVPISVITNGLGYVAKWQEENNMIICESLLMERGVK